MKQRCIAHSKSIFMHDKIVYHFKYFKLQSINRSKNETNSACVSILIRSSLQVLINTTNSFNSSRVCLQHHHQNIQIHASTFRTTTTRIRFASKHVTHMTQQAYMSRYQQLNQSSPSIHTYSLSHDSRAMLYHVSNLQDGKT